MTADEILAVIRASQKPFYVYVLWKPDGTPVYVGAGQGKRILEHTQRDTRRGSRSSLIERAIGVEPRYSVVGFYDTWEEAAAEECRWIAVFGRADLGTGTLANRTDGGDGVKGIKWELTEARKRGIERAAKRPRSAESRAKMSASAKKRGSDPFIEGARKWRETHMDELVKERRARWEDEDYRKRHAKAMANPKTREALRQRMLDRLNDSDAREKLAAAISKAQGCPVMVKGVRYPSIVAAAAALGVHPTAIHYHLKKQTPGYKRLDDTEDI